MKKTKLHKQVGYRLRLVRGARSQREFAFMLGISLPTYQRYERGERLPNLTVLSVLSANFKINADWLVAGKGQTYISDPADNFTQAIENLNYLFTHASGELLDSLSELLGLAVEIVSSHQESEQLDQLLDLWTRSFDFIAFTIRKSLKDGILLRNPDQSQDKNAPTKKDT